MKTYKQFNESLIKALKAFGSKGIRKVAPNVEFTEFGKTTRKFVPDVDLKQFNRTQNLKRKYKNVDNDYKKALMMTQKMTGVKRGIDPYAIGANLKKEPVLKRLARQGKPDMIDANVNLQKKYTARRKDAMQGFKPTEFGPNTAQEKLSKGKGTKARKRAIELLKSRIKDK